MYILSGKKPNKKILFTYDIHRPNQVYFLSHFIDFKNFFRNYPFYAEYIGDLNTELHMDIWVKTNDPDYPVNEKLKNCFLQHDGIVGYELPKNIINFLIQNDIPFINYHNSVYRCTTQLYYALETNLNLSNMFLPKKSKCNSINLSIGTLLIGQMKYDRAVLKKSNFISLMDFEEIIEHLPKPIYFSPHPAGNDELLMWAKIKNYKIAPYPTYELLESKPNLVCGVSSSVLYEARDMWNLPVLFLNENESIKNNIQLPLDIAFDHELIDAIMDKDELKTKLFLGKNYTKYLSSQNN